MKRVRGNSGGPKTSVFYAKHRDHGAGFTLIEVMLAVSLFALVVIAVGQAYVSSNVVMDLQQQRVNAAEDCAALLQVMRNARDDDPGVFPARLTDRWADGAVLTPATDPNIISLPTGSITVSYLDPVANPLEVTLTYAWTNLNGQPGRFVLGSVLAEN